MVMSRNLTCLTLKWKLTIVSFNPARRMHWKTVRMFRVESVAILAAIPFSRTVHFGQLWQLSPITSFWSLKRQTEIHWDLVQVFCRSLNVCPPFANSVKPGSRIKTSVPSVVLRLTKCSLDEHYWYNHLELECWCSWEPQVDVNFRWVFSVQKMDLRFGKSSTVMIPYLCRDANSTIDFSFG